LKAKQKIIIVDEHHEVYLAWKYAIREGIIPSTGNSLIHIDEHADMAAPNLNIDPRKVLWSRLERFTYGELNIANFIVPTLFEGVFDSIQWVRQNHNKLSLRPNKLYVRRKSGKGCRLVTGKLKDSWPLIKNNPKLVNTLRCYDYYKVQSRHMFNRPNLCLDIDLDYFSCVQEPLAKCWSLEVSESEYRKFKADPFHFLRFFDSVHTEARKSKNRYQIVFNDFFYRDRSPLKVSKRKILERIDEVLTAIKTKKISPNFITICRSRYSGYTPVDQWMFIENHLVKNLKALFPSFTVMHLSDYEKPKRR